MKTNTPTIAARISDIYASTEDWRVTSEVSGDTLLVNTTNIPYDVVAKFLACHDLDSRSGLAVNKEGNWYVYCSDTENIYTYVNGAMITTSVE
jgi:hypothetical protein